MSLSPLVLALLLACGTTTPETPEPAPAGFQAARDQAALAERNAASGDLDAARRAFEQALAVEPTTDPERRENIAFRSGLIDVQLMAGQREAAIQTAREGLEERVALGPEARFEIADGAVLLGQVQAAAGQPVQLPEVPLDAPSLLLSVTRRSGAAGSAHLVPVLAALVQRVPDEKLHGALAGFAWQGGDFDTAMASATWLVEHGSPAARFEAGMLIPRIHEDRGDRAAAEDAYRKTCAALPSPGSFHCQRELGLFLAQDPSRTDAARDALRAATRAEDPEVSGRALAALGILEVHEGSEDRARPFLEDAVATLAPDHPDALFARDHLQALGTGRCPCDDPLPTVESTLLAYAEAELPGLVEHVALDPAGAFDLTLSRQPTPEEHDQLVALQERVLAEMSAP